MSKKNLLACSSGGRTSMFKLERLIEKYRHEYNICGIFANTSWEHKETIEFVNKCAKRWKEKYDFDLVWVEAVVNGTGVACTHKVVKYETCHQNMEVFECVVTKYGVPNKAYPHCTRELKENPIHDYVEKILGWHNKKAGKPSEIIEEFKGRKWAMIFESYETALGMRIDEPKRVIGEKAFALLKKNGYTEEGIIEFRDKVRGLDFISGWDLLVNEFEKQQELTNKWFKVKDLKTIYDKFMGFNDPQNRVYPLFDWFSDRPDKLDIIDWWEDQEFDLLIPTHLGNCVGCFKKSTKKQLKALRDAPKQFINTLEKDYGHVGPNKIKGIHVDEPRTMYRQHKTCGDIQAMLLDADPAWLSKGDPEHMNEGCASSCEPFGD